MKLNSIPIPKPLPFAKHSSSRLHIYALLRSVSLKLRELPGVSLCFRARVGPHTKFQKPIG